MNVLTRVERAEIAVVGLGKLGLPLAGVLAEVGHKIKGYDVSEKLISQLKTGTFSSPEPGLDSLLEKVNIDFVKPGDEKTLESCSAAFLIVPTPSNQDGAFSNSKVWEAIQMLLEVWKESKSFRLIVLVSTVMPGTLSYFQKLVNQQNASIKLIYSPEFIAIGSVIKNLQFPDLTLIGSSSPKSASTYLSLISPVVKSNVPTHILTFEEAEIAKILLNAFVTMKISFANFVGEISRAIPDVDAKKVLSAIGDDSRVGKKALKPGLGFGGPCFPRDNRALAFLSNSIGVAPNLAMATDNINERIPKSIAKNIKNDYPEVKKIGIFGITYKAGSTIVEESQALALSNELSILEYSVKVLDPLIETRPLDLNSKVIFCKSEAEFLGGLELLICTQDFSAEVNINIPILKL
jgi:UDPglucose 6-dehydrogenase